MDLTRYAGRSTVRLTTVGRKSGAPRTVMIWFVVDGDRRINVQHVRGPAPQWYKNLLANPTVSIDFGDGAVPARAAVITERAEIDRVLLQIRKKHWLMGPLIQMFRSGGQPVAAAIEIA